MRHDGPGSGDAPSFSAICAGSFPSACFSPAGAGLGDIRSIGSGNIGATNVLRTGNKTVAALTLLLDAFKGAVPVILASHAWGPVGRHVRRPCRFCWPPVSGVAGLQGRQGSRHQYRRPVRLYWPVGLAFLAVWLAMAVVFRMSSLAALTASLLSPLWAWSFGRSDLIVPALALAVAIWHHPPRQYRPLAQGAPNRKSICRSGHDGCCTQLRGAPRLAAPEP